MSLHIAAGLGLGGNESYPGVFQPFGGFSDDLDVEHSFVNLPSAPGLGLENKANFRSMLNTAFGDQVAI
jgi:hypothetical protein